MEVQFPAIVFYLINFGIIIIALQKLLFKPIRSVLNQRAEKIEQGLKAAESNLKRQAKSDSDIEQKLKEAQAEASKIIKDAKKQAATEAQQVLADAKESAKSALVKERQAFETMMAAQRNELNKSFAKNVIEVSQATLQSSLSADDIKKITDKQISNLKDVKFA